MLLGELKSLDMKTADERYEHQCALTSLVAEIIVNVSSIKPALDNSTVHNSIKQLVQQASDHALYKKEYSEAMPIMTNVISMLSSFQVKPTVKYADFKDRAILLAKKIFTIIYKLGADKGMNDMYGLEYTRQNYDFNLTTIMEMKREINELRDRVKVLENGTK